MAGHTPLTVAVSARSLFDLERSHRVFKRKGLDAYLDHVRRHEDTPLDPGAAFPLVRGLLRLNELSQDGPVVEVMAVSSIHPEAGLHIVNSLAAHGLAVRRASFTGGAPIVPYLKGFEVDLLLTKSKDDAQQAVDAGMAAALMYDRPGAEAQGDDGQIRIAFDGDAVIFTDESERIYKSQGIEAFLAHETAKAQEPLADGPFAKLLRTIQRMQRQAPEGRKPFRIALVTARGGNARERVLRTLRAWDIDIDEAHFLSGHRKAGILEAFHPHIFFDDQDVHVKPASKLVPSALVPWRNPGAADETVPSRSGHPAHGTLIDPLG